MLFLGVRGFSDYAGPNNPLAYSVVVVLPSSTRPTDASVYASNDTSRCRPQDSRSGWIRYFLSCRALASPTTCRFIPALSVLPTIRETSHPLSKGGASRGGAFFAPLVELQIHAEIRLHGLQPVGVALDIPLDPALIV